MGPRTAIEGKPALVFRIQALFGVPAHPRVFNGNRAFVNCPDRQQLLHFQSAIVLHRLCHRILIRPPPGAYHRQGGEGQCCRGFFFFFFSFEASAFRAGSLRRRLVTPHVALAIEVLHAGVPLAPAEVKAVRLLFIRMAVTGGVHHFSGGPGDVHPGSNPALFGGQFGSGA